MKGTMNPAMATQGLQADLQAASRAMGAAATRQQWRRQVGHDAEQNTNMRDDDGNVQLQQHKPPASW